MGSKFGLSTAIAGTVIAVCANPTVALAHDQAPYLPGWHAQSPLQMTRQECFERAVAAFNAENWTEISPFAGWSVEGRKGLHRAAIYCIASDKGTYAGVTVATNQPSTAAQERNRLRDRLLAKDKARTFRCGINSFGEMTFGNWTANGGVGTYSATWEKGSGSISLTRAANGTWSGRWSEPGVSRSGYLTNIRVTQSGASTRLEGSWIVSVPGQRPNGTALPSTSGTFSCTG